MLSTAGQLGVVGTVAAVLAAYARWAETRRARRSDLDAVGFMPWTAIYFVALLVACVSLGLAARAWFAA